MFIETTLLYDFNLIRTQELGSNDWGTAMRMAFILYLDIINLLLDILEAMGD
jgi:FtsH-binding integral membrane protein